jgi:hypothetical protein
LKLIGMNDRFAPAHYNLAVAYRMAGDEEKGREHYEKAKALGYPVGEDFDTEWKKAE